MFNTPGCLHATAFVLHTSTDSWVCLTKTLRSGDTEGHALAPCACDPSHWMYWWSPQTPVSWAKLWVDRKNLFKCVDLSLLLEDTLVLLLNSKVCLNRLMLLPYQRNAARVFNFWMNWQKPSEEWQDAWSWAEHAKASAAPVWNKLVSVGASTVAPSVHPVLNWNTCLCFLDKCDQKCSCGAACDSCEDCCRNVMGLKQPLTQQHEEQPSTLVQKLWAHEHQLTVSFDLDFGRKVVWTADSPAGTQQLLCCQTEDLEEVLPDSRGVLKQQTLGAHVSHMSISSKWSYSILARLDRNSWNRICAPLFC